MTYLHQGIQGRIPIIASGGIFSGKDAIEKMTNGEYEDVEMETELNGDWDETVIEEVTKIDDWGFKD